MTKKKKSMQKPIIIISKFFVVLVITTCIIFQNFTKENSREHDFQKGENGFNRGENFQPLDEITQDEITSFFENSPSSSEIEEYCIENPMYCGYYCMEINSELEICSQMQPPMHENMKK